MKKIVIIRGKVTAGKSTTSHALAKVLPGWVFIDIWKIKEMFEPLQLKNRKPMLDISKKAVVNIVKDTMKKLGNNIIIQESTTSFIKRKLGKYLKDHNYKVYTFFLDIDLKSAIQRDIQREKPTMGFWKKKYTPEIWEKTKATSNRGDIIIHTKNKTVRQVVNIILKEIGEKRQKHPKAHWIRKAW